MSYRVSYNPELSVKYALKMSPKKKISKSFVVIGLVAALATGVWMRVDMLRFLIPGDPDVTAAAFSEMVERVEMGEPLRESLLAFCREIIVNGS